MAKPKNLVIVESPAKAKTIARFLGSDYEVKSSFGHVRDLPKKSTGVDVANNFEPTYEISPDKQKVVAELKRAAKGATVWLASDEDREGEAIAWHVSVALGLDSKTTKRIAFHEITKPAIEAAVANPRTIDMKLVDAQQSRRILDRLVGYELSPVLWKKIRAGLSAGRVQSVAVRLIVEREREIKEFSTSSTYRITGEFKSSSHSFEAELNIRPDSDTKARHFLEVVAGSTFKISAIDQKPGSRSPSAPFTTSTLQQEAARRLGYSVRQTMVLAQRLYEHGHITYMRTDSMNLSGIAIDAAKKYIASEFGEKYLNTRQYKTKSAGAQEAHEAIRPTHMGTLSAGQDSSQKKLYELIWRRTMASQMASASVEKTDITIDISARDEKFVVSGEVLLFDGFLKVYGGGKDDKILPPLENGQTVELASAIALETYSRPPARYSEAALVKKLEQLGIGRPSTYAPTIGTIQDRGYIEKKDLEGEARQLKQLELASGKVTLSEVPVMVGADRNKLVPTPLAEIVTDFLVKYFGEVMDYDFTAEAEAKFDDVAEGKLTWQQMLADFYGKFHPLVEKSAKADRAEAAQARELGKDPKTGKPVIARFGRFGPMIQLGETGDAKDKDAPKPLFASLPEGTELDTVTLEQALPMFNLPREVGKTKEGEIITADTGRYGPYVKVGKQFYSIKGQDPLKVTEAEAIEVIKEKAKAERERVVADWGELKILRGPYGPYVTNGKKNARIPKDTDPEKLTQEQAKELLDKAPAPTGRRRFKPKKAK